MTIKVKVFVNMYEGEVLNEKQAMEVWKSDYYESDAYCGWGIFNEWLNRKYDIATIFTMSKEEKDQVMEQFKEYVRETSMEGFLEDYTDFEIEVEI